MLLANPTKSESSSLWMKLKKKQKREEYGTEGITSFTLIRFRSVHMPSLQDISVAGMQVRCWTGYSTVHDMRHKVLSAAVRPHRTLVMSSQTPVPTIVLL